MPNFTLTYTGIEIQTLLEYAETIPTLTAKVDSLLGIKSALITTDWIGASAPYTQTIAVAGVTENDEPDIFPIYSSTLATALLEKDAWNAISKIETGNGTITCTCFQDKPITSVNVQIKGV